MSVNFHPPFLLLTALFMLAPGCRNQTVSSGPNLHILSEWTGEIVVVKLRAVESGTLSQDLDSIKGRLVEVHESSVIIQSDGELHWIPAEVILLIRKSRDE